MSLPRISSSRRSMTTRAVSAAGHDRGETRHRMYSVPIVLRRRPGRPAARKSFGSENQPRRRRRTPAARLASRTPAFTRSTWAQLSRHRRQVRPATAIKTRRHLRVTNVNSHSLGIEGIHRKTDRKQNVVLIPRNTPLPARISHHFVTKEEGQRSVGRASAGRRQHRPARVFPRGPRCAARPADTPPAGLARGSGLRVWREWSSCRSMPRVPGPKAKSLSISSTTRPSHPARSPLASRDRGQPRLRHLRGAA